MSNPFVIPGVLKAFSDPYMMPPPQTYKPMAGPGVKVNLIPNPPKAKEPESTLHVLKNKQPTPATPPTFGMTAALPF